MQEVSSFQGLWKSGTWGGRGVLFSEVSSAQGVLYRTHSEKEVCVCCAG